MHVTSRGTFVGKRALLILFVLGLVLASVTGGGFLGWAIRGACDSARSSASRSHLYWLGYLLKEYHRDHGAFPPRYVADEPGKAMHSWRVLLLPYLEEKEFYDQYDFDEPWNGPRNSALAKTLRADTFAYCKPDGSTRGHPWTDYVAVAPPDVEWPAKGPLKAFEVMEGSDRFLVVELPDSGIHWMEPRDSIDR